VANFGAQEAVRLAQDLELAGRLGALTGADRLVSQLDQQTRRISRALDDLSGASLT